MNRYDYSFTVRCPTDGDMVDYHLTIETGKVVPAEHIREACDGWQIGLHEDIANNLSMRFPGKQTLSATHRGVHITTVRQ
jgi:hypothetical protein